MVYIIAVASMIYHMMLHLLVYLVYKPLPSSWIEDRVVWIN